MSDEHSEYGHVMPFIVCASRGGPYDDKAFVAGARFGALDQRLAVRPAVVIQSYEPPELLSQLDLLAMHHGYEMTSEPWEQAPDEWALVTFRPSSTLRETPDA